MKIVPSEMFKVLAVETRVKIIELLKARGPLGAKKISERLGVTPAAVSQHLKVLRQAGLVRSERKGYWIPYSIDEKALDKCRHLLEKICTCGCEGSGRFKEKELETASLGSLESYEKELEKELDLVRERIEEIGAEKK